MKKHVMIAILLAGLSMGLMFSGCGNTASSDLQDESAIAPSISGLTDESITETTIFEHLDKETESSDEPVKAIDHTNVMQGGPYGKISLSIPTGWNYETYTVDSGQSTMGMYGICFYPEDVSNGYIELTYTDSFGVCGTGLEEKKTVLAGQPANIGTYDNNAFWDFISFQEDYRGIVALTYYVDDWWETYSDQVTDILDTLSYDSSTKEGGAYIHSAESEIDQIGLSFSLKNISPTGATLVFHYYDADAPTGSLQYGNDYLLEVQKDSVWEEAAIILEGDYGFDALAYVIPSEGISELDLNWEWLYGTLSPGTYRIQKNIMDFRETGDYDKYTVYAQFILN